MKTVFVLFDSLNRSAISPYAGDAVDTPNFARLAERAVTFDTHYVGSLPCMPARRDMQTGRTNFLHRNWGPLEPFDNSVPQMLREVGAYTHMITDHHHYFHDGGATYHNRFNSYESVRGQSTDHWKGLVTPPLAQFSKDYHPAQDRPFTIHDRVNRLYIRDEEEFSCPQVFRLGREFLNTNGQSDNWFLQVESFDPHEPFFAPERFRAPFKTDYQGPRFDWPLYGRVREGASEVAELRANYASLVAMCDWYLGTLLDTFDALGLWEDTALVVTTDHGFLLGEHDYWGKNLAPVYDELARVPLIVYHPDHAAQGGSRRRSLTQVTDLAPTFLEWFGQEAPAEMTGRSLTPVLENDTAIRASAIYGYFGAACNITDGRYTYLRYPESLDASDLHEYTLMPMRFGKMFSKDSLRAAELVPPFDFTQGVPVLKVAAESTSNNEALSMDGMTFEDAVTRLFDTQIDPGQLTPVEDRNVVARMTAQMCQHFEQLDAPAEIYHRFGLEPKTPATAPC